MRWVTTIWLMGLCANAVAHDYWLERDGNQYVLHQGHRHSGHQGEAQVPYDIAIVQRAHCAGDGGVDERPRPAAYPARFDGPCAALAVELNAGYWSQTLTGTVNKPKSTVSGALRGWLAYESVKRLDAWTPVVAAPLNRRGLELVPLENPLALTPGDKLRLRAMWRGQPKAGVTVAYDGQPRGTTDADGKINLRVRHGGEQIIAASFEEPAAEADADRILYGTILQFRLPEKK